MTPSDPIIAVDRLTRRFDSITAVQEVSFDVRRGELFGIVGPDGSGKTTLLRMLAGVLRPSTGDAIIDGVSVARDPERVKHSLAYMSQRFGLYTDLTVLENLEFYADLYEVPPRERPARLERLFQFSGLGPFRDRLAGRLSGGMKQKLGLSCALIHQPDLLILDEPTFGVDPMSRRDLWIIIHERVAEDVTVVVSTSYMDEAERFDRVGVLDQGAMFAIDSPSRLLESLDGRLLELIADPVGSAKEISQLLPSVRRAVMFGNKLHLTVEPGSEAASEVRRALEGQDIDVQEIRAIAPSMEDVFIERTTRPGVP